MRRLMKSIFTVGLASLLFMAVAMPEKATATTHTKGASAPVQNKPTPSQWKKALKGAWVLNSVDRENLPQSYTVKTIFEEAPPECFIGSVWTLPSSGKGNITFSADGRLCAPGAVRNIVWSIYNPGANIGEPQFQMKKVYAGEKASAVQTGYRLALSYTDGNKLVLRMPVTTDEGNSFLVFNFTRSN